MHCIQLAMHVDMVYNSLILVYFMILVAEVDLCP
jgi:hypothetical protein